MTKLVLPKFGVLLLLIFLIIPKLQFGQDSNVAYDSDGFHRRPEPRSCEPKGHWDTLAKPPQLTFGERQIYWTGSNLILWHSGLTFNYTRPALYVFEPAANGGLGNWVQKSTAGVPESMGATVSVWTGTFLIVYGQALVKPDYMWAGRYDPTKDTWTPISLVGGPGYRLDETVVWTGREMIFFGGQMRVSVNTWEPVAAGVAYDPAQ